MDRTKVTVLEETGIFTTRGGYDARLTVRHAATGMTTFRATLHRDAYDNQSYVMIEAWISSSAGWRTVSLKTAEELPLPKPAEKDRTSALRTLDAELEMGIRIGGNLP